MSDAVYATANTLPEQIKEMAIRIQKMVGKKPDNFNKLVFEYYEILVDIGTSLSITVEAKENADDVTSIRDLTNHIVTILKSDGAVKQKLSDQNLTKLHVFFVKYEDAIKSVESGLPKSGTNNCFMNATLQMFYHIPEVKGEVLGLDPVLEKQQEIRSAFEMLNGNKLQGELSCSLTKGRQHDAHEYIMSDFVPAVLDIPGLKPIFNTEFVTESNGSETFTDQPVIGVPIIPGKSVEEMIISSLKEQADTTVATPVDSRYTRTPKANKYLLVHLKRSEVKQNDMGNAFIENDGKVLPPTKINTTFSITPDTPLVLPNNEGKYKLRGLIEHIGRNLTSGHYVYHWLNDKGVWYTFDDSTAKPWSETTSPPLGNGYIYLYERVTAGSESVNPVGATHATAVNPTKLMVYDDDGVKKAHGFISENKPYKTNIHGIEFVQRTSDRHYNPHWWLDVAYSGSNNEGFQELVNKELKNLTPGAKTVTIDDIEYEIVDQSYLKKTNGGRRRTRKNKRRITKRKNKTKKHYTF